MGIEDPFLDIIRWVDDRLEDLCAAVFKSPKMMIARGGAMSLASAYHLDGDDDSFRELWFLTIKASLYAHAVHEDAEREVDRCLEALRLLVQIAPTAPTQFGTRVSLTPDDAFLTTQVANVSGNFVVFSDHHMLHDGARQNFFKHGYRAEKALPQKHSNYDLYLEILSDYYGVKDFCLIENGDVEELLIYEPKIEELRNANAWSWTDIESFRSIKKFAQLPMIAADNRTYYEIIQRHFVDKQKYFRLTGNHDREMRDPFFVVMVRAVTGTELPLASDLLLLRGENGVEYAICHGHQFDTTCTPKYAPRLGETFSVAGAWAYQGPDRVWREGFDPIADWRSGKIPFRNELVSDLPDDFDTVTKQLVRAFDPVTGALIDDEVQFLVDALGAGIGNLDTQRGWENLYGKNIAWEYFDNASPERAVEDEVEDGKRWFKFRHMNEFRFADKWESLFDGHPPRLILGHSHEPRFRPGYNVPGQPRRQIEGYLNCASAGRFENLIWGIELIEGEPFLISWHREERGSDDHVCIRTLWEDDYSDSHYVLRPVASATIAELLAGSPAEEPLDPTTFRVAADLAI